MAFEPPLASVEGIAHTRASEALQSNLRGQVKSPPNYMEEERLPEGGQVS